MRLGAPLALAVVLCSAAPLPAQPKGPFGKATPPPVVYYSVLLLRNEAVHRELKLDDDQARKATLLAQKVTPAILTSLRDPKKTAETAKEIEKGLAFLTPVQRRRLRELSLQRLDGIPAGPRVLAADAGLHAELKLTKAQKDRLAGGAAFLAVLTADQKKALDGLKGRPVDASVLGPAFRGTRPALPTTLQYLDARPVAVDLKLTEAQRTKLDALAKQWVDRPRVKGNAAARAKRDRALADDIEREARALLTGDQARRLAQIVNQVERRDLRRERDVFTLPVVAEGLKLTEAQKKQLARIVDERQKGLLPLFTGKGEAKDVLAAVQKYNADTYKQLLAALTKEQATALDGLFGKPLEGQVRITAFLPVSTPWETGRGPARAPLHLYIRAMTFAGSAALHKELGLNADQKEKLTALGARTRAAGAAFLTEEKMAALAAATEKELAPILKPPQVTRLGELVLQQLARAGASTSSVTLSRFVEVRKGLQLTPAQLEALSARGATLAGVLTEAQKARWTEMLGPLSDGR
jgi:hypothetical protein